MQASAVPPEIIADVVESAILAMPLKNTLIVAQYPQVELDVQLAFRPVHVVDIVVVKAPAAGKVV